MIREETVAIGTLELDGGARLEAVEQRVTIYGTPRSMEQTSCSSSTR